MGIVNVTADSFSDGGQYLHHEQAVAHGLALAAAGADIIDVGGESTRPGATRVAAAEEEQRVVPVIQALSSQGIVCSVDTMRASVAKAAVASGAALINDVSGGQSDPAMLQVMADAGVPVCLMHWKTPVFGDAAGAHHDAATVVDEVRTTLRALVRRAEDAGVDPGLISVDPGIGFAKTPADNWALLQGLRHLVDEGYPVLVGASRKRFLQAVVAETRPSGAETPPVIPADTDVATAAVSVLAATAGASMVRVHAVQETVQALAVARAWGKIR
ncbi:dihydropteroate synthase [Corynebacterium choanae]|nr:dihydropteroate synthase [Corynebacterium choanae]